MLRWLVILLLLGFTAAAESNDSEPPNYCQSPESWAEWQELLAKYPHDRGLQTLHALRLGICLKVDCGEITLDDGTALFEEARSALMAQKQEAKRNATSQGKADILSSSIGPVYSSKGTTANNRGSSPTLRAVCPCPVRSSSSATSPAWSSLVSSSTPTSTCPDRMITY